MSGFPSARPEKKQEWASVTDTDGGTKHFMKTDVSVFFEQPADDYYKVQLGWNHWVQLEKAEYNRLKKDVMGDDA